MKPGEADLVLVDAPCSGTGSLAREPQAKWKLTPKAIADYVAKQGGVLDEVAGAKAIVYATCSVLRDEDEAVVEAFVKRYPRFALEKADRWVPQAYCEGPFLRVWPHRAPGGGFFAARLTAAAR